MVGKPNVPRDASDPQIRLDRDRAASMADEGGVSGAHIETQAPPARRDDARGSLRWPTVLGWSALAAGCAMLATWLLRRSRARGF